MIDYVRYTPEIDRQLYQRVIPEIRQRVNDSARVTGAAVGDRPFDAVNFGMGGFADHSGESTTAHIATASDHLPNNALVAGAVGEHSGTAAGHATGIGALAISPAMAYRKWRFYRYLKLTLASIKEGNLGVGCRCSFRLCPDVIDYLEDFYERKTNLNIARGVPVAGGVWGSMVDSYNWFEGTNRRNANSVARNLVDGASEGCPQAIAIMLALAGGPDQYVKLSPTKWYGAGGMRVLTQKAVGDIVCDDDVATLSNWVMW